MAAIKGGDVISLGNQVLIDRIQTVGPGSLNIPEEKINEVGNYYSVATVRDTPDLSFSCESFDVSAEFESMLRNTVFSTDTMGDASGPTAGTKYELAKSLPIDVANQFKRGKLDANLYDVSGSVVIPYLALESMEYRFGVSDNARQTATLKGDSIYYTNGSAYILEVTGTNAINQVIHFTTTGAVVGGGVTAVAPIPYNGDVVSGTRYALGVSNTVTGQRLILGRDYTETSSIVTILAAVPVNQKIRVSYQSAVVANYPQVSHALESATRPAAIKGKYLKVYVGGTDPSNEWSSVQAATATYRVQLDRDFEFGNTLAVAQDYDIPDVSGSIDIKPQGVAELITKLRQVAGGVASSEVIGPLTAAATPLYIKAISPVDGKTIKTIEIPDARFLLPGYSAAVQAKLTLSISFSSDSGAMNVYKGDK